MAVQTKPQTRTSPCLFCKHDPCERGCPHRVLSLNGDAILPDDPTERDKLLEDIYRESSDFSWWSHPGTAGDPFLGQPFRGFPVGEFTETDFAEFIDKYHSKGFGWVYENISPYDREKGNETPPTYLGIVIVCIKSGDIAAKPSIDEFVLQAPRWMNSGDKTTVFSYIKDVIQQFLNTDAGKAAWENTCENFNWGDIQTYVPDDHLRSHGILPISEANEHQMSDIMVFTVDQNASFDAPEEDIPLF